MCRRYTMSGDASLLSDAAAGKAEAVAALSAAANPEFEQLAARAVDAAVRGRHWALAAQLCGAVAQRPGSGAPHPAAAKHAEALGAVVVMCLAALGGGSAEGGCAITGGAPEEAAPAGAAPEEMAPAATALGETVAAEAFNILGGADSEPGPALEPGPNLLEGLVSSLKPITFEVQEEPGDEPLEGIMLDSVEDTLPYLVGADEIVAHDAPLRILYTYPLSTCGPTPREEAGGGWVFEEKPPGGARDFRRGALAAALAERYRKIYAEESEDPAGQGISTPGLLHTRSQSAGPYGIWGFELGDLALQRLEWNAAADAYEAIVEA